MHDDIDNFQEVVSRINKISTYNTDIDQRRLSLEELGHLAESENVRICYKYLPKNLCSLIFSYGNRVFIIINVVKEKNAKWFSLAHEMGHYFLHDIPRIDNLQDVIADREIKENEADYFANIVLVPSNEFDELFERNERNIDKAYKEYLEIVEGVLGFRLGCDESGAEYEKRGCRNLKTRVKVFNQFRDKILTRDVL